MTKLLLYCMWLRCVPYGTWLRLALLFFTRKKVGKKSDELMLRSATAISLPAGRQARFTLAHNSPRVYNAPLKQMSSPPSAKEGRTFTFAVASGIATHMFGGQLSNSPTEHMAAAGSGAISGSGALAAQAVLFEARDRVHGLSARESGHYEVANIARGLFWLLFWTSKKVTLGAAAVCYITV